MFVASLGSCSCVDGVCVWNTFINKSTFHGFQLRKQILFEDTHLTAAPFLHTNILAVVVVAVVDVQQFSLNICSMKFTGIVYIEHWTVSNTDEIWNGTNTDSHFVNSCSAMPIVRILSDRRQYIIYKIDVVRVWWIAKTVSIIHFSYYIHKYIMYTQTRNGCSGI